MKVFEVFIFITIASGAPFQDSIVKSWAFDGVRCRRRDLFAVAIKI